MEISQRPISQIVIPARLQSTRLARKLLLRETGKSVLQHTYEAACRARRPRGVIVAADSDEIAAEVHAFGGEVRMTSPTAASGTDRIAEVARDLTGVDIVVNVQGDEPELSGDTIDLAVELLAANPAAVMSTLATPIRTRVQLDDPACVKVVFEQSVGRVVYPPVSAAFSEESVALSSGQKDGRVNNPSYGRALYFSRSPIPHARQWSDDLLTVNPPLFYQHIGLYAYRREFLLQIAELERTPLEKLESLEQLRVLEHGHAIMVGVVDEPSIGIDTPADYAAFVERWKSRS